MVDQYASHGLCSGLVEVRAVLPRQLAGTHQTQEGLVHEGGRLQRVVRPLTGEKTFGELTQLCIDERHQALEALVAIQVLRQQEGNGRRLFFGCHTRIVVRRREPYVRCVGGVPQGPPRSRQLSCESLIPLCAIGRLRRSARKRPVRTPGASTPRSSARVERSGTQAPKRRRLLIFTMRTLRQSLASLLALSIACTSVACTATRRGDAHGGQADAAAHAAHQDYVDAINSNDLDRLLEMLTDDVVFMAPDQPPMVGKDTLTPWLAGYYEAFETHWDKPQLEFVVNGDWAFERYSYRSTDKPRAGGEALHGTGWGLVIFRRGVDGKWRVARDAWGSDQPQ